LVRHLGSQSGSAVVSPTSRLPERIVWISLLGVSLVMIGGLLRKLRLKKRSKES
jgi:hypothetical protein